MVKKPHTNMDRVTENRLKRCQTCECPNEGSEGKCPGNLGLGCLADWRCCAEMKSVCEGCKDCQDMLYCTKTANGKTTCRRMEDFRKVNS